MSRPLRKVLDSLLSKSTKSFLLFDMVNSTRENGAKKMHWYRITRGVGKHGQNILGWRLDFHFSDAEPLSSAEQDV